MYVQTRKLFLNLTKSLIEANRHRHSDGNVNDTVMNDATCKDDH